MRFMNCWAKARAVASAEVDLMLETTRYVVEDLSVAPVELLSDLLNIKGFLVAHLYFQPRPRGIRYFEQRYAFKGGAELLLWPHRYAPEDKAVVAARVPLNIDEMPARVCVVGENEEAAVILTHKMGDHISFRCRS